MSAGEDRSAALVAGSQLCMYGTETDHCGEPARMHVMQTNEHPTMSCRRHESYWITAPCLDAHPIEPTCGLPGTSWVWSWNEPPGRCVVEGIESPALAGAVPAREEP